MLMLKDLTIIFRNISNNKYLLEIFPQKSFSRFQLVVTGKKTKTGIFQLFCFLNIFLLFFDKDALMNAKYVICFKPIQGFRDFGLQSPNIKVSVA